ncbi:MAG: protein-methionine-sulfoxide reductase catalytic subunit MsrP [Alphaproteobacteria bacterium]|nr:MAG: protein-methionine-sulfoxide reductase catalytic subunit MsrP [Alphaproteobacteria bacterium]
MLIKHRRASDIHENHLTPERVYLNRRALLKGAGLAIGGSALAACDPAGAVDLLSDPNADLYPAARNEAYQIDRPLTAEALSTTYNNFYEFGSHKRIAKAAQKLTLRPWEIAIDGEVEAPFKIGFDDLIRKVTLEERYYRHRCVEAWSMDVPWTGFPLRKLVELAKPLSSAKYLRMETFQRPSEASGQKQVWYPWPYVEGLTIKEATHDLAFMVTGLYGKPLPKQNGAPLRLAVPWKYGFKSIKSIVRFTFTEKEPVSFWQKVDGREYGFWANVNPGVDHRRWSQATEQVLGTQERIPTRLFNGYAEEIGDLYADVKGTRNIFF